eukprot:PITA_01070
MDGSTESLLCEENLQIDSPWSKDLNTQCIDHSDSTPYHDFPYYTGHVGSCSTLPFAVPEDYDEAIKICLEKESDFMPSAGYYLQHLRASELCDARRRAVFWMNKALIISSAVNHMDRFLWKNRHDQTWNSWMMELVSIGCLSIAAKMDEINVPPILDFQVEGIDHVFESYTLQRMELIIMKALGWRMNPVTPFSYTEAMAQHLRFDCIVRTSIVSRVTELLLGSLFEAEFVEFRPSIVALAAMLCALEELVPLQAEPHITELSRFLNAEKVDLQKCYRFMEERIVDPLPTSLSSNRLNGKPKFPTSPVTCASEKAIL